MKLVQKFILFYLLLSLVVLSLGGVYYYVTFTELIDKETDYELKSQVNQLSRFIDKGVPYQSLNDKNIQINRITDTLGIQVTHSLYDTMAYHGPSKEVIHHRKINKVTQVQDQWYRFQIFESVVEPLDTFYGTFKATAVVFLLLSVLSVLYSLFISKWLLKPFHHTLSKIKDFNVQTSTPLVMEPSRTYEFEKLNDFIENMTNRTVRDYNNLKEFSENIAHEIRTPLAIASGKLDLLIQDKNQDEQQMNWIVQAQNALNKVSKIQQSLVTLSRIENEEFNQSTNIQLKPLIETLCLEKEDIFELKDIHLKTLLSSDVTLQNDPVLIEVLLHNLLQNAIKHNLPADGFIDIQLTRQSFVISNSGAQLNTSTADLMKRFKKNSAQSDSIGLGLSIVKKICEVSGYTLTYEYFSSQATHQITIRF
ncbi:hypothetical protein BFP72_13840 [Reichenbachiella sp. 5M10]|uniref:sensor histidine kinase n=1 Tax=Reichenbachiella sp. 5M10 TaxID=1889772 RepID=UPI000C14B4EF|nr:HAMP domain-containing sensor histidine kinase [Reichenbachiella sp. 5M10]PIB36401.1 hypothetical protein BFP72_13840 [Reichenbachiella sp. 5M10]